MPNETPEQAAAKLRQIMLAYRFGEYLSTKDLHDLAAEQERLEALLASTEPARREFARNH